MVHIVREGSGRAGERAVTNEVDDLNPTSSLFGGDRYEA